MSSKKSHIQLYADECFPVTSVTHLKSKGFSIIHAYDKKLFTKSVNKICLKALKRIHEDFIKESCVLITTGKIKKVKNDKVVFEKKLL